jgi:hypothetical protein
VVKASYVAHSQGRLVKISAQVNLLKALLSTKEVFLFIIIYNNENRILKTDLGQILMPVQLPEHSPHECDFCHIFSISFPPR